MTIELFSNITQTMVVLISAFLATISAVKMQKREYILTAGILVAMSLGIIYWLTYQFLETITPQIFYVSDISWFAAYLFMLSFEMYVTEEKAKRSRHFAMYLPFPIILAITIYFCQWGDILLNVAYMIPLVLCAYFAIRNLIFGDKKFKALHIFFIVFIITEYCLWLASCFWISDTLTNPYFWFDFALTIELGMLLPIVKRAVS